jgi:hypothetical protein
MYQKFPTFRLYLNFPMSQNLHSYQNFLSCLNFRILLKYR